MIERIKVSIFFLPLSPLSELTDVLSILDVEVNSEKQLTTEHANESSREGHMVKTILLIYGINALLDVFIK